SVMATGAGVFALTTSCSSPPASSPSQPVIWYEDVDGAGVGADTPGVAEGRAPAGHVERNTECADTRASTCPGAPEVHDGEDNDCDGAVDERLPSVQDWYRDVDGDGFGAAASAKTACKAPEGYVGDDTDCNDSEAAIRPGAPELCDGRDNDCDGVI